MVLNPHLIRDWPLEHAPRARDELACYLDIDTGLSVLPRFMKAMIRSVATGRPSVWIERFNRRRLGLLSRCVEPLAVPADRGGHTEFAALCATHASAADPFRFAAEVGAEINDDYFFYTWEDWAHAARSRGRHAPTLYALANAWAQLDFRPDIPGSATWPDAWHDWARNGHLPASDMFVVSPALRSAEAASIGALAEALRRLGRPDLAAKAWLELDDPARSGSEPRAAFDGSRAVASERRPSLVLLTSTS